MDFIATLVGDDNTFIFRKYNPVATSGLDGFNAVIGTATQSHLPVEHATHHKRPVRVVVYKTHHHLITNFRNGDITTVLGHLIGAAGIGRHHADKAGGIVQLLN